MKARQKHNPSTITISRKQQFVIGGGLVALLAGLFGVFALVGYALEQPKIADYASCTKSNGSMLQESYPEICVTKDGQRFQNPNAIVRGQ